MFANSPESSPERQRDRRVTIALVFFWSTALVSGAFSWLWPERWESIRPAIDFAEPVLALIYAAVILYVIYACVRHANSYRYKGKHPVALSLVLLAGHIVAGTIYHLLVVLRR